MVNPSPPCLLNHILKCHIYMFLEPLQGRWLHHCPGQPVPTPDHSFSKEIFPNIQPEPPLTQPEAINAAWGGGAVQPHWQSPQGPLWGGGGRRGRSVPKSPRPGPQERGTRAAADLGEDSGPPYPHRCGTQARWRTLSPADWLSLVLVNSPSPLTALPLSLLAGTKPPKPAWLHKTFL